MTDAELTEKLVNLFQPVAVRAISEGFTWDEVSVDLAETLDRFATERIAEEPDAAKRTRAHYVFSKVGPIVVSRVGEAINAANN
jgi:hypothetical protein